jgi:predicted HTH domain antitoxin
VTELVTIRATIIDNTCHTLWQYPIGLSVERFPTHVSVRSGCDISNCLTEGPAQLSSDLLRLDLRLAWAVETRKLTSMEAVQVSLPAGLLKVARVNPADASPDTTMLLTLELYRENKISLGRAAELCQTSVEAFMVFAGRRKVPMHYSAPGP